jgi:hypothetical protein
MKAAVFGAILIALGACGKGDKAQGGATNSAGDELPRQGGCDTRAKNNICVEYFGQPGGATGITSHGKSTCEQAGGTVVEKCVADGALGRCISQELRIQQMVLYAPLTKEKAEQMCKGMGDGKLGPI